MITRRFGDYNFTKCIDGNIVKKDSPIIEFCGTIDEVVSYIGVAKSLLQRDLKVFDDIFLYNELESIQKILISLPNIDDKVLAKEIIKMDRRVGDYEYTLTDFIIPGDNKINSIFHYIRSLIRKIERTYIFAFKTTRKRVCMFLNRLSLYLFVIAEAIKLEE